MYTTQYPTNIPNHTDLPDYQDDVDDVTEEVVNDPKKELLACLIELGTLPKGSTADLSTRLAVSLNNDGSLKDTLSPTFNALTVGNDGTNYCKIKDDGEINLHGTGRVNRHLIIDAKRFKLPGANYPSESFEGLFYTLNFDKTTSESAYCQEHVPFRWASGTDITVIINWLHDTNQADAAKKVRWGIEYKAIKISEAVTGAGTTITQDSAGNHNTDQGQLIRTTFTTKILGSALEIDDILALRVFRDAGNDDLDEDARLINFHIHFIQDKLGEAR